MHEKINERHESVSKLSSHEQYQSKELFEYLGNCYDSCVAHYDTEENKERIKELREKIRVIAEYQDAKEVYKMICQVLCEYRSEALDLS